MSRPAIRIRPVPPLDPPFEDEVSPETWLAAYGAAQLTFDWPPAVPVARSGPGPPDGTGRSDPVDPSGAAGRASATGPQPARPAGGAPPADGAPRAGVVGASVDAGQAASRFLGTCLEILDGYRPVGQIRRLSRPIDTIAIAEQLAAAVARVAAMRQRAGAPSRRRIPLSPAERVQVKRLRVCEPRPGAVEATAVLETAGRTWALAWRLERRDGAWLATAARVV